MEHKSTNHKQLLGGNMRKSNIFLIWAILISLSTITLAQIQYERKVVKVPKVQAGEIVLDGKMDEAAWQNAGQANLITNTGYEIFTNKYYREDLTEPDYDELYARLLYTEDTLYVFIHIDEIVNDSTNLFWDGKWTGDQLFVGLSNKLGLDYEWDGRWNGNVFTAPDGPLYYLILGDKLSLNGGDTVSVPEGYRGKDGDTLYTKNTFDAYKYARMATVIDTTTGLWNIELAFYNPAVKAQGQLGFNLGGSTGSRQSHEEFGDAYGYFCWQPNVKDDPYAIPPIGDELGKIAGYYDPGVSLLVTPACFAVLEFEGKNEVFVRQELQVPQVDPAEITFDGKMNEAAWDKAAKVNLITNEGYNIFTNKYYREELAEPDYDELYARLLWAQDTLYAFIHIDEMVNDSTNLFWDGLWTGDQLFVSITNRLGLDYDDAGRWNGNVFTAPNGPLYYIILGDQISLNGGDTVYIPEGYRQYDGDTTWTHDKFDAAKYTRMAVQIDTTTGKWDIELAIFNQAVAMQSSVGFNIGGSTGSRQSNEEYGDAYAYYTWQPNVPDDPYAIPPYGDVLGTYAGYYDPGVSLLVTTDAHAVLHFVKDIQSGVEFGGDSSLPVSFTLDQNYPNPFNPSTTIRFNVQKAAPVTMRVYNALGQLVTTLFNNQMLSSGTHLVTWNAANLSSGIYFYSLEMEGQMITKKMVFLK